MFLLWIFIIFKDLHLFLSKAIDKWWLNVIHQPLQLFLWVLYSEDAFQGYSKHNFFNKKRISLISSIDINITTPHIYCSSDSFFCAFIRLFSSFLHAVVTKFQCLTLFRMTPFKQQWHPVVSKPPSPSWWHAQPTSKQWWLIPLCTWPIWLMTSCRPSLHLTLLLTLMSLLMR